MQKALLASLESYNPYLLAQKVLKNPKIYCIHSSLSKNAKNPFGCLGPLGVKKKRKGNDS
jgi:hypothetical protein